MMSADKNKAEYRAIKDNEYADYYVSPEGKVYNKNGHEIYGQNKKRGCLITMSHKRMIKQVYRAILVAEAFIENPDGYVNIRHKNGNVYDDRVEKLEWVQIKSDLPDYAKYDFTVMTQETEQEVLGTACKAVILHNTYTGSDIHFPSIKAAAEYVSRVIGLKHSSVSVLLSRALQAKKQYRCFMIEQDI